MTRQLHEILDQFSNLDDDEAMERIKEIRKAKYETKPAAIERKRKQTKRKIGNASSKMKNLLKGLSEEEKDRLLKELEDGEE